MNKAEIEQKAIDFLNKRTKQKENLVITRAEAISGLVDFYTMLQTADAQKEMKAFKFIESELDKLIALFPQIRARYQFYIESDVHYVEIMPNLVYIDDEKYIDWEEKVTKTFYSKFKDQSICFVSDNAICGIDAPDYIVQGHEYVDNI